MAYRTPVGRGTVVAAALLAALAAPARAAGPGATVHGTVVDEQGQPLAGVQVVVTAAEATHRLEATTKKKGVFVVRVPDRAAVWEIHCSLEGYADAVEQVQPGTRDMSFVAITMASLSRPSQAAPSVAPAERSRPEPPPDDGDSARAKAIPVFNQGAAALEEGDLATAEAAFRQAAVIDPSFPDAHRALAAVAMEHEDYAAAAASAERVLDLQSDNVEAARTVYYATMMLGDPERLAAATRRVLAMGAEASEGEVLGHARQLFQDNAQALARAVLEPLVEARPTEAEAHYLLGMSCNALDDEERARQAFRDFLALAPDHPDAASARSMLEYLQ